MALVMAPSYSKAVRDQYYMEDNVAKTCRDYVAPLASHRRT